MSEQLIEKTPHCQHGRTHFAYCADCHVIKLQSNLNQTKEELERLKVQVNADKENLRFTVGLYKAEVFKGRGEIESLRAELEQVKAERDKLVEEVKFQVKRNDKQRETYLKTENELLQVKADSVIAEMNLSIITEELSAKDKVLEWVANSNTFHMNVSVENIQEKARSILSQYKGEPNET